MRRGSHTKGVARDHAHSGREILIGQPFVTPPELANRTFSLARLSALVCVSADVVCKQKQVKWSILNGFRLKMSLTEEPELEGEMNLGGLKFLVRSKEEEPSFEELQQVEETR